MYIGKEVITFRYCYKMCVRFSFGAGYGSFHWEACCSFFSWYWKQLSQNYWQNTCVLKESWPVAISMSPLLSSFLLVVFLANLFSVALIFLLKLKFVLIIDWQHCGAYLLIPAFGKQKQEDISVSSRPVYLPGEFQTSWSYMVRLHLKVWGHS